MGALDRRLRTLLTLSTLSVLLVVAAGWGWSTATKPFPGAVEAPTCVDTTVPAGSNVYPDQVTVSVLNASGREGLAGRTLRLFQDAGFHQGDAGNAPDSARVEYAQVWSATVPNPAARLVASRLGPRARVIERVGPGAGITVIVGDGFQRLVEGRDSVTAQGEATVCSPPQ